MENVISVSEDNTDVQSNIVSRCAYSDSEEPVIVIPDTVSVIAPEAFALNSIVRKVVLPSGLKRIEAGTFRGCVNIDTVVIPDSVCYIGKHAFLGCISLKSIELPESLIMIDEGAFEASGLCSIYAEQVQVVGKNAFADCSPLESVSFPNVIEIGDSAFIRCVCLRKFGTNNSLISIGSEVFRGCSCLKKVQFSRSLQEVGNRAFIEILFFQADLPENIKAYLHRISRFRRDDAELRQMVGINRIVPENTKRESFRIFDYTANPKYY